MHLVVNITATLFHIRFNYEAPNGSHRGQPSDRATYFHSMISVLCRYTVTSRPCLRPSCVPENMGVYQK